METRNEAELLPLNHHPYQQLLEIFWTQRLSLSHCPHRSLLSVFGLTDHLEEQVQHLYAEPAN